VDVLPDEPTLAAILAHELSHVVLGHRLDTQYAFLSRLRYDEKQTFRHFGFARTPEEEQAANQKARELLKNSPYSDQSATAQLFLQALQKRSKEIPNLISPHLGDRVTTSWAILSAVFSKQAEEAKPDANAIVALPLGGRIKVDPWDDQLKLLKSKPVNLLAATERRPFEITPFFLYLTRQGEKATVVASGADLAKSEPDPEP
jgi:hypothetical protein